MLIDGEVSKKMASEQRSTDPSILFLFDILWGFIRLNHLWIENQALSKSCKKQHLSPGNKCRLQLRNISYLR